MTEPEVWAYSVIGWVYDAGPVVWVAVFALLAVLATKVRDRE